MHHSFGRPSAATCGTGSANVLNSIMRPGGGQAQTLSCYAALPDAGCRIPITSAAISARPAPMIPSAQGEIGTAVTVVGGAGCTIRLGPRRASAAGFVMLGIENPPEVALAVAAPMLIRGLVLTVPPGRSTREKV